MWFLLEATRNSAKETRIRTNLETKESKMDLKEVTQIKWKVQHKKAQILIEIYNLLVNNQRFWKRKILFRDRTPWIRKRWILLAFSSRQRRTIMIVVIVLVFKQVQGQLLIAIILNKLNKNPRYFQNNLLKLLVVEILHHSNSHLSHNIHQVLS